MLRGSIMVARSYTGIVTLVSSMDVIPSIVVGSVHTRLLRQQMLSSRHSLVSSSAVMTLLADSVRIAGRGCSLIIAISFTNVRSLRRAYELIKIREIYVASSARI